MNIQLLTDPSSPGSRWLALFNPIVLEYQFQEYPVSSINYNIQNNNIELDIAQRLPAAEQTLVYAGQPVYIKTSQYQFTGPNIHAGYDSNFGTTTFSFPSPNNGTTVDGFINIVGGLPGLKVRTEITASINGVATIITADHAPNLKGYCRADISKYLRVLLQPADAFDYSTINYLDANLSASYTIRYQAIWDGGQTAWQTITQPFYVTYSAMQLGNPTGGNMAPFVTSAIAANTPARFMNDFDIPTWYTDMPFDICFIYAEQLTGKLLKVQGNGIDINGNVCGKFGELMLLNEDGSALKHEDGTFIIIDKQIPGSLTAQVGVNRLCFNKNTNNIPANSYYLDIWLCYTDANNTDIAITETKRLRIDNSPCNHLPFEYLKWIGPSGGWLYYMLTKNQFHELNTSNAVLLDRYITDYAAADSTQQLISINAHKKITAGKNDIPAAEAEALATILYSPKVYRLVNAATNTWQGVIIDTKSLKMYQTYGALGDFEISYLLPEVNVQRA